MVYSYKSVRRNEDYNEFTTEIFRYNERYAERRI